MAPASSSIKAISKQINVYMRRHSFVLSSTESFTTSQRRAFLRDVYDYARALGLGKKESKQQVIRAREMCGEDDYDTDVTALENEIDDSETIFTTLQTPDYSRPGSMVPALPIGPPMSENAPVARREMFPVSGNAENVFQKRKRPAIESMGTSSRTPHTSQQAEAKPITNHRPRGRPPNQRLNSSSDIPSGDGWNSQRSGNPSKLSQQTFTGQDEERELVPRTRRVPTRVIKSIEQDSDTPDAGAEKKQLTSHPNTAMVKSTNLPATNADSKNVTTATQNFIPPEVAAFSDDDQDVS